jgi:hypothetical protein
LLYVEGRRLAVEKGFNGARLVGMKTCFEGMTITVVPLALNVRRGAANGRFPTSTPMFLAHRQQHADR